jgi:hypothetical protein
MVVQATLLSGLAKAATNKAVQAAAVKLAQDVYGRILPARKEEAKAGDADGVLLAQLRTLASKEEVAAAFSLLQAELDRRHRRTVWLLAGIAGLQLVTIALVVAL